MSLVAYADSSDDDDNSENSASNEKPRVNGYISDEEESAPVSGSKTQPRQTLSLPLPKVEAEPDSNLLFFGNLPLPKATHETKADLIEEEDDEFLHKKATPIESPKPILSAKMKNLVRITIPSLKDFDDVEETKVKKTGSGQSSNFSSLMSMLPRPKSEQSFVKSKTPNNLSGQENVTGQVASSNTMLVPDTVKNRRPAQNTENIDRKVPKKPPPKPKPKVSLVNMSDSEGSDNEGGDFFSLKNDDILPEVSAEEITAMVSKKAAEMAQVSTKFSSIAEIVPQALNTEEPPTTSSVTNSQQLDKEAIQALIGGQAKRRKMDDVEIIDITSDQVLPNKDDWLRTALASATTYQPTGVLTDEEPAAGTRRKHQITYLAHKAKANEAELQAMWSANRQNRRQTQSKYGF